MTAPWNPFDLRQSPQLAPGNPPYPETLPDPEDIRRLVAAHPLPGLPSRPDVATPAGAYVGEPGLAPALRPEPEAPRTSLRNVGLWLLRGAAKVMESTPKPGMRLVFGVKTKPGETAEHAFAREMSVLDTLARYTPGVGELPEPAKGPRGLLDVFGGPSRRSYFQAYRQWAAGDTTAHGPPAPFQSWDEVERLALTEEAKGVRGFFTRTLPAWAFSAIVDPLTYFGEPVVKAGLKVAGWALRPAGGLALKFSQAALGRFPTLAVIKRQLLPGTALGRLAVREAGEQAMISFARLARVFGNDLSGIVKEVTRIGNSLGRGAEGRRAFDELLAAFADAGEKAGLETATQWIKSVESSVLEQAGRLGIRVPGGAVERVAEAARLFRGQTMADTRAARRALGPLLGGLRASPAAGAGEPLAPEWLLAALRRRGSVPDLEPILGAAAETVGRTSAVSTLYSLGQKLANAVTDEASGAPLYRLVGFSDDEAAALSRLVGMLSRDEPAWRGVSAASPRDAFASLFALMYDKPGVAQRQFGKQVRTLTAALERHLRPAAEEHLKELLGDISRLAPTDRLRAWADKLAGGLLRQDGTVAFRFGSPKAGQALAHLERIRDALQRFEQAGALTQPWRQRLLQTLGDQGLLDAMTQARDAAIAKEAERLAADPGFGDWVTSVFPQAREALERYWSAKGKLWDRLGELGVYDPTTVARLKALGHLHMDHLLLSGRMAEALETLISKGDPDVAALAAKYRTMFERATGIRTSGTAAIGAIRRPRSLPPGSFLHGVLEAEKSAIRRMEVGGRQLLAGIKVAELQRQLGALGDAAARAEPVRQGGRVIWAPTGRFTWPLRRSKEYEAFFRAWEERMGRAAPSTLYLADEVAMPLLGLNKLVQASEWLRRMPVLGPLWSYGMGVWKLARTAYYLPTIVGNLLGGAIQENIPGRVPGWLIPAARTVSAIDLHAGGPLTRAFEEHSAGLGTNLVRTEAGRLYNLAGPLTPRPGHVGEEIWGWMTRALRKPMDAYAAADRWARLSIFTANRWMGLSDAEAAKIADLATIRYDRIHPLISFLGDTGIYPFVRFYAGSVDAFAREAIRNPARYANWLRAFRAVTYADATPEQAEAERTLLPPYAGPYAIRANFNDAYGRPVWATLRYTFPLVGEENLDFIASLGGPLTAIANAITGQDAFTGQRIFESNDPPDVKIGAALNYLLGTLLVPHIPMVKRVTNARRAQPILQRALEKRRSGLPLTDLERRTMRSAPTVLQAILRSSGIRLYPVDTSEETVSDVLRQKQGAYERAFEDLRGFILRPRRSMSPVDYALELWERRRRAAEALQDWDRALWAAQALGKADRTLRIVPAGMTAQDAVDARARRLAEQSQSGLAALITSGEALRPPAEEEGLPESTQEFLTEGPPGGIMPAQ